MQQLLLILICLFLSFEVRSENDDLSGKKLVCEYYTEIVGLEFLDIQKVKKTHIYKKKGTSRSGTFYYTTTPTKININRSTSIDRLTLKLNKLATCKFIEDNLDSYMKNKLEIILNEIKSKQKI